MEDKKHIQIITERAIWERWVKLAKDNGMPLVSYIKHLLSKELNR